MNENLDLVEILKDCPRGTKLYSPLCGEVVLNIVDEYCIDYPIEVNCYDFQLTFTRDGRLYDELPDSECVLFPSKDQRDWSKFKVSVEKFDYSTLKPFDRVLVRNSYSFLWRCNFFSHFFQNVAYCTAGTWDQVIPYNDETKHLVGTKGMPDEKYIWWKG